MLKVFESFTLSLWEKNKNKTLNKMTLNKHCVIVLDQKERIEQCALLLGNGLDKVISGHFETLKGREAKKRGEHLQYS